MTLEFTKEIGPRISAAVAQYWSSRSRQEDRQRSAGRRDQGSRGAVTGGAQMDGFVELFRDIAISVGISQDDVFSRKSIDLPGYFRPAKKWDLIIVSRGKLLAVIEAKSQVGPSFGNNFNNRTEEAMGSAHDLWTAYREGKFGDSMQPWVGYFFMIEDCEKSRVQVSVTESHFKVFPEFVNTSYTRRYEIFCTKLMRERLYTRAALLTSTMSDGLNGKYAEPSSDLSIELFVRSLAAHLSSVER